MTVIKRDPLAEAIDLLDNARPDYGDPALKRRWAQRRKALRAHADEEGDGQQCTEGRCTGRVSWEATADAYADDYRGAVDRAEALERAIRAHRDALRAGTAITDADRVLHRSLDPAAGEQ